MIHSIYQPYVLWAACTSTKHIRNVYILCNVLTCVSDQQPRSCTHCQTDIIDTTRHICSSCPSTSLLKDRFLVNILSEFGQHVFFHLSEMRDEGFLCALLGAKSLIPDFPDQYTRDMFSIKCAAFVREAIHYYYNC